MSEKDCNRAIGEETDVKLILITYQFCSERLLTYNSEAEFLDEIPTKVFLRADIFTVTSALRFIFLQTHATSYRFS